MHDSPCLQLLPVSLRAANAFVQGHHRHHRPVQGAKFALAVTLSGSDRICGVAIVGRPVARHLDDGWTLEVTRLCTDGSPNACSKLYGATWKAARALGYTRLVTYTLPAEGGTSLRAAGWRLVGTRGGGAWTNMVALGVAGALAGIPDEALGAAVRASWRREASGLDANLEALRTGIEAAGTIDRERVPRIDAGGHARDGRWLLSGNEGAGLGALRGGIRFVAAYPITPATEMLEWMAPALTRIGGTLLQAEDELASINMAIGASFGGVPSLTATAGPGLSLMAEGIGLAVSAEVPVVIVDVMRGGPSTGIPAKSEQSDLSFAVDGLHGDAPRLVLAPTSITDCVATTQWAVTLAESTQAPAIVLSDQFMGQSRAIVDRPADPGFVASRLVAQAHAPDFKRYRNTDSGVSPMAIPGTPGTVYTADGLEKSEAGIPSSQARDHAIQLDKRERKLRRHDYGRWWADVEGAGDAAILTFGSVTGVAREALARLAGQGMALRLVALRLLAPALPERLAEALEGVSSVLVVEQNHSAQLFRYLRAMYDLPGKPASFHRPGPLPIRPGELADAILEWRNR